MSTPISFMVFESDGVTPDAAATPTFSKFATRANVDRSAPTIDNIGEGKYTFEPSDADETIGCAYLISTGGLPAYVAGAVTTPDFPFAAVAFFNADGTPITTGTPTVPTYQDFAGTPIVPPALASAGASLWTLTPTAPELAAGGVNYAVASPAGALPAFYDGDLIAVEVVAPPSVIVPVISNYDPARPGPLGNDETLGFDVTVSDDSGFSNISIVILFDELESEESVYDGFEFSPLYLASSSAVAITNGFRFRLNRRAGWPENPIAKVRAVTASGVLNA